MLRLFASLLSMVAMLHWSLAPVFAQTSPVGTGASSATSDVFAELMQRAIPMADSAAPAMAAADWYNPEAMAQAALRGMSAAELEAAQAAAAGGGLGSAMTWGALGLAGLAAGTAFCLTIGSDVCGKALGQLQAALDGQTNYPIQSGTAIWSCANGLGGQYYGSDGSIVQACEGSWQSVTSGTLQCSPGSSTATSQSVNCTYSRPYNGTVTITATKTSVTVQQPLSCPSKALNSSGTACASPVPPGMPTGGARPATSFSPSDFSADQLSQPASPQIVSNVLNNIQQHMTQDADPNIAQRASQLPQWNPNTVQVAEAQTGLFPTLADLLKPVQEGGALIVQNPDGSYTLSSTTSLAPVNPQNVQPSSTQLSQATPCGNTLAGESPCDEVLNFRYNPRTNTWEWDGTTSEYTGSLNLPAAPNQDQVQRMTRYVLRQGALPDMLSKTGTSTGTQVDTLTDPRTRLEQITKTATSEMLDRDTPVRPPIPGLPTITLPFNEWPQVFKSFNTDAPNISGQCPTVSFDSVILHTHFTFSAQCLVLDSLKPYMRYVLPPTYLFMALLFIMAA